MNRHVLRIGLAGLGVLVAFACAEAPPAEQQGSTDESSWTRQDRLLFAAATVGLPPSGLTPADLPEPQSQGAQLLARYCAQCHALPTPAAHSATDWPSVVRRMWLRMEWLPQSYDVKVPNAAERTAMLQYLTGHALQVSGSMLPPGHGRDTFAEVCSRCHALPDPGVHSRQDWAAVFQRMERNMEKMKMRPLTRDQTSGILIYLQGRVAGR